MENKVNHVNVNPSLIKKNPYKGQYPYEEEDKELFYGRETECEVLLEMVRYNFLTVVFGKSGIGKTSLLNAGLFPELKPINFIPIKLYLNYSSKDPDLLDQLKIQVRTGIEKNNIREKDKDEGIPTKTVSNNETLWEYFHRSNHFDKTGTQQVTPVLVLDQFEGIFNTSKDKEEITGFVKELFYLIENQVPASLKKQILNDEKEFPYSYDRPGIRIIIILREDYLPHLTDLKVSIPSIDRVTFRVIHMDGEQAREVITKPENSFNDKKIIEYILNSFPATDKEVTDKKLKVEPFILSLLCSELFKKYHRENKSPGTEKAIDDVIGSDKNEILKNFYENVLKDFPGEVEEFIEERLITEEDPGHPFTWIR